jgi:imidazole glycerol-phosphate synthase subunit HisF
MLKIRVIPCLLLKGDGLVKTVRFSNPTYLGDPINAVRIFNAKKVPELVFLDIMATKEGRHPNTQLISRICNECYMPLTMGGGIRSLSDIQELLRIGVEKVVVNTYAFEDPEFIKAATAEFGSQSIVVAIDAKKDKTGNYKVWTKAGSQQTERNVIDAARMVADSGAGEILLNSIDRDGMMQGYDVDLIRLVADGINIPVIACGGAGNLHDFTSAVRDGHASAVAAGSIFVFHGPRKAVLINFPTVEELENIFAS